MNSSLYLYTTSAQVSLFSACKLVYKFRHKYNYFTYALMCDTYKACGHDPVHRIIFYPAAAPDAPNSITHTFGVVKKRHRNYCDWCFLLQQQHIICSMQRSTSNSTSPLFQRIDPAVEEHTPNLGVPIPFLSINTTLIHESLKYAIEPSRVLYREV